MTDLPKQMIEAGAKELLRSTWKQPGDLIEDIEEFWAGQPETTKNRYRRNAQDCITAALAALWQPIEEAPKDDEDKLLLAVYERYPKDLSLVAWKWNEWTGMCDGQAAHEPYGAADRHTPSVTHFIDPSIFPLPTPKEGK